MSPSISIALINLRVLGRERQDVRRHDSHRAGRIRLDADCLRRRCAEVDSDDIAKCRQKPLHYLGVFVHTEKTFSTIYRKGAQKARRKRGHQRFQMGAPASSLPRAAPHLESIFGGRHAAGRIFPCRPPPFPRAGGGGLDRLAVPAPRRLRGHSSRKRILRAPCAAARSSASRVPNRRASLTRSAQLNCWTWRNSRSSRFR